MIYRVNKVEDLSKIEQEIDTEAIIVIDKVLPYNCSGVMFKTNKGWSKVFLDSTQLNRDATINGSLTVLDNLSVIGATDIDLGFTGNLTINAGNEANSKVIIDNVEDIELSADAEILINAVSSVALNANDTLGNFTKVELLTTDLNIESNAALLIQAQDTVDINSLGDINMSVLDKFKITGLQSFADNAAALLGGLNTDMIYKTATGELRIVV